MLTISVSPLFVKQTEKTVSFGSGIITLRDFQLEALKHFGKPEKEEVLFLKAPTGAGKTFVLLTPLIANIEAKKFYYYSSVGIYPSKELAADQMKSVHNLLLMAGAKPLPIEELITDFKGENSDDVNRIIKAVNIRIEGEEVPVILLLLTAETLEVLSNVFSGMSKLEIMRYLSRELGNSYRILFSVPEYPYLLAVASYTEFHEAGNWLLAVLDELRSFLRALTNDELIDWFSRLERKIDRRNLFWEYHVSRGFVKRMGEAFLLVRGPVFFDEFHLYSGFSLNSFIALLFMYMYERGIKKICISSATPKKPVLVKGRRKDILSLVKKLANMMGYEYVRINAKVYTEGGRGRVQIRKRTHLKIIPKLLGKPIPATSAAYGYLQRYVVDAIRSSGWVDELRKWEKGMVLVDRLATTIEVGEKLKRITGLDVLIINSAAELLSDKKKGDIRKAKLIVGNMAVSFGVDIPGMDFGFVLAKDRSSAIQKIGRFGRGARAGDAVVYLLVPARKYYELKKVVQGKQEIPYVDKRKGVLDFIKLIKKLYPREPSDILAGKRVGIIKTILPVWVYVLANMVRQRSEVREQLSRAKTAEDVRHINEFTAFLNILEEFFEYKNLRNSVRAFIRWRLNLTPRGVYALLSFRNIVAVPVESGDRAGSISLVALGRNIPFECRYGEIRSDPHNKYSYTDIKIVSTEQRTESIIKALDGSIVSLGFLSEALPDADVYQGKKKVCTLRNLVRGGKIADTPALVLHASDEGKRYFIMYASAMENMLRIYVEDEDELRLVGGVYLF